MKQSSFNETVNAEDYGNLVSAMSKTVLDLSREVARGIQSLSPKQARS